MAQTANTPSELDKLRSATVGGFRAHGKRLDKLAADLGGMVHLQTRDRSRLNQTIERVRRLEQSGQDVTELAAQVASLVTWIEDMKEHGVKPHVIHKAIELHLEQEVLPRITKLEERVTAVESAQRQLRTDHDDLAGVVHLQGPEVARAHNRIDELDAKVTGIADQADTAGRRAEEAFAAASAMSRADVTDTIRRGMLAGMLAAALTFLVTALISFPDTWRMRTVWALIIGAVVWGALSVVRISGGSASAAAAGVRQRVGQAIIGGTPAAPASPAPAPAPAPVPPVPPVQPSVQAGHPGGTVFQTASQPVVGAAAAAGSSGNGAAQAGAAALN